jgi:hypothetical protein
MVRRMGLRTHHVLLATALNATWCMGSTRAWAQPPPESDHEPGRLTLGGTTGPEHDKVHPDEVEGERDEPEPRVEFGADSVLGFGRRAAERGESNEHATSASTVFEGSYRIVGSLQAGVLIPFSHEAISPSGERPFTENVIGNVALALRYRHGLTAHLGGLAGLVLAAPTALGDRFSTNQDSARAGEANEWAALSRAFAEDELFAPHRACAVPSLGLDYRRGSVDVGGGVKAPILAREGGKDPSRASGLSESSVAVEFIPSVYGFYEIRPAHLALGAAAYAVYFAVDEVRARNGESGESEPKVQPVVEPEARLKFDPLHLAVGYILPLGGRLNSGAQRISGVRLALGVEI